MRFWGASLRTYRSQRLCSTAVCMPDVAEPADDNGARLVRAAQEVGAAVFVTGERWVLGWGSQGGMKILSPRDA